jgi:PBP1b-binding outer membrane lipoprotein LpoB
MNIKKIISLALITGAMLISGCASAPSVRSMGAGQYVSTGESEFGYTKMVDEVHQVAEDYCRKRGREMIAQGNVSGYGSTGFAGSKRAYTLGFTCK